jgi:hypothetical protein
MKDNEEFWDRPDLEEEEYYEGDYEEASDEEDYSDEPEDPNDFMDVYEEEYEDMAEEELMQKSNAVLDTALIRLEQGKLYKLIMQTIDDGMFGEVDCDERSIKNVEREMKAFIMSRLEVLLGIRKKVKKVAKPERKPERPRKEDFDDMEKAVLKKVVSSAIKKSGIKMVSEKPAQQPAKVMERPSSPKAEAPKPAPKKQASPRPQQQKPQERSQQQKPQQQKPQQQKPQQQKPQQEKPQRKVTPKSRAKKTSRPEKGEGKKSSKHPYQMSSKELIERNKRIGLKSSARLPEGATGAVPMPTSDEMQAHYNAIQAADSVDPRNQTSQLLQLIKIAKQQGE